MARQNTSPVTFSRSVRSDQGVLMSSGRAGKVIPIGYIPMLRGDSASGRFSVDFSLAEMPRPLLNAVMANVQAWFVPKSHYPQFSGLDEFNHAYLGEPIKSLGATDRTPPEFFKITAAATKFVASDFAKTLGIHVPTGANINTDIIDAFNLVYNFRLAAHSSKLARKKYYAEDADAALAFGRAFWPSGRFSRVVPDYERALIIGALDLDVSAGQLPIKNLYRGLNPGAGYVQGIKLSDAMTGDLYTPPDVTKLGAIVTDGGPTGSNRVFADMLGQSFVTSLADIDKARTTQAFAKLRTSYAGNDTTGFDNDNVIVAHLMQGLSVPEEHFKRPWLLDSKRIPFGFAERFATNSEHLDASITTGRVTADLSINVPQNDFGGYIVVTAEVLPERLDERQTDEMWLINKTESLPNALRDIQRTEPVDMVLNRRLDAKHSTPQALYGYEPMNDVWNRAFTRLGGAFYQADPSAPVTDQRAAIWQSSIKNPAFTADHWLAPDNFPHAVFSDTTKPAFEFVARHSLKIVGLTQIGDVLSENNDDYDAVKYDAEIV